MKLREGLLTALVVTTLGHSCVCVGSAQLLVPAPAAAGEGG